MSILPIINEHQRLEALYQYQSLDASTISIFDDLVEMAANCCQAPTALITFVDAEREWFKSKIGMTITSVSRHLFFGQFTILENDIFIIPDTLQDPRFASIPIVISEPYCRFYAGLPLISANGFPLGCLCIIDVIPRDLSMQERTALKNLVNIVNKHLGLHRKNQLIERNFQEMDAKFRAITQAIPVPLIISRLSDGLILYGNQKFLETFNWTLDDVVHRQTTDLYYHATTRQELLAAFSEHGFLDNYEVHLKKADGTDFWAITSIQFLSFHGEISVLKLFYDITARKDIEAKIKTQAEREQLMRTIGERIRQSLNLQDILNATVEEVRNLLQVDRVIVFQFAPDMSGKVVAESVQTGWTITLGQDIQDTCFQTNGTENYAQGNKRAIANIYEASLTNCHIQLLTQFEVKANLVVPILLEVDEENNSSRLWGLLIAHQCSGFRDWETSQLDLLDQLTVQIAIAIQQSSIFLQAQNELLQRQKIEVQLRAILAEKEVLLKEIHHRVKNNLQIVSSLLQLQSHTIKDIEVLKIFRESQNRIESISLIHKNLYTAPNIGQLDVADYINNLATSLLSSYQIVPGQIGLETYIDTVNLNVDQAIACGLIVNELITNALKHAFPNQKVGNIIISLHTINSMIEMIVQDNGIGLPNNLDWRNTDSLGLSLVYDLVTEQLEGSIQVERHQGTVFQIQFPQLIWHQ